MPFENFEKNLDVRRCIASFGLIEDGDTITPEDYESIMTRAHILKDTFDTLTEQSSIALAYLDRMAIQGKIKPETFAGIENETLLELGKDVIGETLEVEEELEALKKFLTKDHGAGVSIPSESFKTWKEQREQNSAALPNNYAVIDSRNSVVGIGTNPKSVMRDNLNK